MITQITNIKNNFLSCLDELESSDVNVLEKLHEYEAPVSDQIIKFFLEHDPCSTEYFNKMKLILSKLLPAEYTFILKGFIISTSPKKYAGVGPIARATVRL